MNKISKTKEHLKNEDAEFALYLMSDTMYRFPAIYKCSDTFKAIIPALIESIQSHEFNEDEFTGTLLYYLELLKKTFKL